MDVGTIRRLAAEGRYEFSKHAEKEREGDMIPVRELEEALVNCEVIEDYPDDPRGPGLSGPGILGSKASPCGLHAQARSGGAFPDHAVRSFPATRTMDRPVPAQEEVTL